ncbi:hypothetical protein [Salinicoccus albus]|uniref:hypothetical protein n=1 Tax=Salinicoccus albus TaxID=418756 RepID=UPI00036F9ECB|nr:hypothetical protein [Salinicoccus albus]
MYFLKRNIRSIIIYMLVFGVIGTIASYFLLGNTYDYETYYPLDENLTPSQEQKLSDQVNQSMAADSDDGMVSVQYDSDAGHLRIEMRSVTSNDVSSVSSDFENILDAQGITYDAGADVSVTVNGQYIARASVIGVLILLGLIAGMIHSLLDRRVKSDEDVHHYLDEKVIGKF